jgi:hypothetical protein
MIAPLGEYVAQGSLSGLAAFPPRRGFDGAASPIDALPAGRHDTPRGKIGSGIHPSPSPQPGRGGHALAVQG